MIGIHLQNSTRNWPAVANTRAAGGYGHGKTNKILFGAERASEVTEGQTWYRWVGEQPLPTSDFEGHAKRWLEQFVDETFINKSARHIWLLNEYNETLANSQSLQEKARWVALHTAMAKVWWESFRAKYAQLSHIRLVLCETAVGNDIPLEIARAAERYDCALGYHPYIVCNDKAKPLPDNQFSGKARQSYISPHDWRWYSGRWAYMDESFVANGVRVDWAFGEMGPVLDASNDWSGWLDPIGGWRSCLSGDIEKYKRVMDYWLVNATRTRAYNEDRIIGGVLFTTGAPMEGQWDTFDIRDGDLSEIINHTNNFPYPKKSGTFDPPPPPPPPPAEIPEGKPRQQYRREYRVVPQDASLQEWLEVAKGAYETRTTIGFSYDDAGIGALAKKSAVLYGIPSDRRAEFITWFETHYPGTAVEFRDLPDVSLGSGRTRLAWPTPIQYHVTQYFGENYDTYMDRYGIPGHNGIDIGAPVGTQVFSAGLGEVTHTGYDPNGYGYYIKVRHAAGLETRYAHLNGPAGVAPGEFVSAGDVLGVSGQSGWSSGAHLHFEVRENGVAIDPLTRLI